MKEKATGPELISYLKQSCKESHKLFVPDSPRQDDVADSLVEFYDKDLLYEAIDLFVKSRTGPFLLFDFAIESKKLTEKVKKEKESRERFIQIVKETHDRMVNE